MKDVDMTANMTAGLYASTMIEMGHYVRTLIRSLLIMKTNHLKH